MLERFVKVKLYTDRETEPYLRNRRLRDDRFQSNLLPLYVFLTPGGREVARLPRIDSPLPSKTEFLEALSRTLRESGIY